MEEQKAPLYGLILAGGKSTRMGVDKGTLSYHGQPQQEVLLTLIEPYCERSFLSIRADQQQKHFQYGYILDSNDFKGPFKGLLSAHAAFPEAAWLVLACDLPFMDKPTVELLVASRDSSQMATTLATQKSGLPEPLAAIWEPAAFRTALDYLPQAESSCPRKFLLQQEIQLIYPKTDEVLINANSPEDLEWAMQKILGGGYE